MKPRTTERRRNDDGTAGRRNGIGSVFSSRKGVPFRHRPFLPDNGTNDGMGHAAPDGALRSAALRPTGAPPPAQGRPVPSTGEPGAFAPVACVFCGQVTDRFPVMVSVDAGEPRGLCERCIEGALACRPESGRYCGILWLVTAEPARPSLPTHANGVGQA